MHGEVGCMPVGRAPISWVSPPGPPRGKIRKKRGAESLSPSPARGGALRALDHPGLSRNEVGARAPTSTLCGARPGGGSEAGPGGCGGPGGSIEHCCRARAAGRHRVRSPRPVPCHMVQLACWCTLRAP